jgi:hypothetical protein
MLTAYSIVPGSARETSSGELALSLKANLGWRRKWKLWAKSGNEARGDALALRGQLIAGVRVWHKKRENYCEKTNGGDINARTQYSPMCSLFPARIWRSWKSIMFAWNAHAPWSFGAVIFDSAARRSGRFRQLQEAASWFTIYARGENNSQKIFWCENRKIPWARNCGVTLRMDLHEYYCSWRK